MDRELWDLITRDMQETVLTMQAEAMHAAALSERCRGSHPHQAGWKRTMEKAEVMIPRYESAIRARERERPERRNR